MLAAAFGVLAGCDQACAQIIAPTQTANLTAKALAESCSETDPLNVSVCELYLIGFWEGGTRVGLDRRSPLFCTKGDVTPAASSLRDDFIVATKLHPELLDRTAAIAVLVTFQVSWPCK